MINKKSNCMSALIGESPFFRLLLPVMAGIIVGVLYRVATQFMRTSSDVTLILYPSR